MSYSECSGQSGISLILGPMFSGKSTELLRRIKRFSIARNTVLLIKYGKDKRYSETAVATHDGTEMEAVSASTLEEVKRQALGFDVIGIDEGQFFPDIVSFCDQMASKGKTVVVAALDGTFQRKPFGKILELVPLAESVVKLSAVCLYCSKDASFSKRIVAGTEVEVIGGAESYVAVCRPCYDRDDLPAPPTKREAATPRTCGASSCGSPDVAVAEGSEEAVTRQLFSTMQVKEVA